MPHVHLNVPQVNPKLAEAQSDSVPEVVGPDACRPATPVEDADVTPPVVASPRPRGDEERPRGDHVVIQIDKCPLIPLRRPNGPDAPYEVNIPTLGPDMLNRTLPAGGVH